jgi:hypothetical protein
VRRCFLRFERAALNFCFTVPSRSAFVLALFAADTTISEMLACGYYRYFKVYLSISDSRVLDLPWPQGTSLFTEAARLIFRAGQPWQGAVRGRTETTAGDDP